MPFQDTFLSYTSLLRDTYSLSSSMNKKAQTFFSLELDEQIQRLYREGSFQVSIRYYGYKVNLYLVEDEMVEVFYNHKEDRIEKIQPLDYSHTRMKFYADQISLKSLQTSF